MKCKFCGKEIACHEGSDVVGKVCYSCLFDIYFAAISNGYAVENGVVTMPCPRPAIHNPSASPLSAARNCEDCGGTNRVPAAKGAHNG